jgi:hypothetical protein
VGDLMSKNNKINYLDFNQVTKLIESSDIKERVKFNPNHMSNIEDFFNADPKDRITLLHSVRGETHLPDYIIHFLNKSHSEGKKVYVPMIYNYQQDETGGIQICNNMRLAVEQAGTIAVAYNPASEGTKFDFGMSIYHDKPLILLNPNQNLPDDLLYTYMKVKAGLIKDVQINNKSFIKKNIDEVRIDRIKEYSKKRDKNELVDLSLNYFVREGKTPGIYFESIIEFGFLYASKIPFKTHIMSRLYDSDSLNANVIKRTTIEEQLKLEESLGMNKSYTRVAKNLEEIFLKERNIK